MFGFLTVAGDAIKAFIGKLIAIALLIALLAAVIFWSKNNPQSFRSLVNAGGDAFVSTVTWGCDWVVAKTDDNPRT